MRLPEELKLSGELIRIIFLETLRGKSLGRTLMNYCLSEFELAGNILDLGSGPAPASYHRFLRFKEPFSLIHSDYYQTGTNLIKLDLEKPFQVEHDSFDYIMCFNVLEHIYNFKNVIKESYKILKGGGLFIGSTPFLQIFHPDPHDYFRYSHEALLKMLEEENYVCQRMIYLGFGMFTSSVAQWAVLVPRVLRPWPILASILLDIFLNKLSKSGRMRYPLGYVFACHKADSRGDRNPASHNE